MRTLERSNPFAPITCIICISLTAAFCQYPVTVLPGLMGGALYFSLVAGRKGYKTHVMCFLLIAAFAIVNPIVSHNGVTVMFILNDRPVTFESFCVGLSNGAVLATVIYYFACLTRIMTSDKLLYVFGKISPKSALIISGALRFIPLLRQKAKQTGEAQTALGLYKKGNMASGARNKLKVFSALTSWALENGIITADSMASRGYSDGKRTYFAPYPFRACDGVWIALYAFGAAALISLSVTKTFGFVYYPRMISVGETAVSAVCGVLYAVMCFLPSAIYIKEAARWKYLISKV